MFRARYVLARINPLGTRKLCTNTPKPTIDNNSNSSGSGSSKVETSVSKYEDAYRKLDNLDFMTAAKILFSEPPKKKKFGIDFHLVQLLFACLPSLAVYLVAQYARSEMKKMDAELEVKKKKEEEDAKQMELKANEEKVRADSDLQEVKLRLDKLEEVIKEVVVDSKDSKKQAHDNVSNNRKDVVDSKKQAHDSVSNNQKDGNKNVGLAPSEPGNSDSGMGPTRSSDKDDLSKQKPVEPTPGLDQGEGTGPVSIPNASKRHQRHEPQSEGPAKDTKR